MRAEKKIQVDGLDVTVKELTVGEIRAWFKELQSAESDVVNELLFEEVGLADLQRMTDLTDERLADLTPSDLQKLIQEAKRLNGSFFGMRARLMKRAQEAMSQLGPQALNALLPTSSAQSAP